MDINERIALAKARINGDSDVDLMKRHGISKEGGQYCYGEYRYDNLQDAVGYAIRNPMPTDSTATLASGELRLPFTVLGGSGWAMGRGTSWMLHRVDVELELVPKVGSDSIQIPRKNLTAIEISGPGTVASNAGIVGGGFGLEGAAIGMLVAGSINAATSRKSTDTVLRLATRDSEVFLHTSATEPAMLRLMLSPEFVHVEALRAPLSVGFGTEIEVLKRLEHRGLLTHDELRTVVERIMQVR